MAFMKRLSGVIQAKANKALDKVEDPRDTLDLSYEKQLEQLQQIKRSVAEVATAKKRIELQAQQLQTSASKLQGQAKQALAQNREDLAREALSRRAAIATQLEGLKGEHDKLAAQQDTLERTTQQLEARVQAFRTQKETLKASYTAAQAQTKIGEAVSGISESMSDTGLAMQRAQDKIEAMQARAGAMDELLQSGTLNDLSGSSDPLQSELDKTSQTGQVELELAQMKGELGTAAPAAAIAAAPGGTDEEPVDGEPVDADAPAAHSEPAAPGDGDLFSLEGGERLVIIRILHDAQYEIDDSDAAELLDRLDDPLEAALQADDALAFEKALETVGAWVRLKGAPLDAETIVPSDRVLPEPGTSLSEVRALLASEGGDG